MGVSPLVTELSEVIKTRTVDGKPLEVKAITNINDAADCDMLFLPSYKHRVFPRVMEHLKKAPILIVSNHRGLVTSGGCIDIFLVDGKINYEINNAAIEGRGLKISNAVKTMGRLVSK